MLHFSDVMYGFQYGVDLTAFVADLDPLRQFKMIASLSSSNFLKTGTKKKRLKTSRQAMIPAFRLTSEDTNDLIPFDETEEAAQALEGCQLGLDEFHLSL
jgi:hypothetical protein